MGGTAAGLITGVGGNLAYQAAVNGHGRKYEDQADEVGLYYMVEAGYDDMEAPEVWRVFSRYVKDQDKVSNFFFSDHSTHVARIQNLTRAINADYRAQVPRTKLRTGEEEFHKAAERLKQQNAMINGYWSLYTDEIDGIVNGSMTAGTAWPINLRYTEPDAPVAAAEPTEGMTGWADTWMISANAQHPNCMLKWMDWTMQPDVQAEVSDWYGAAGSNVDSCQATKDFVKQLYGKSAVADVDTIRYGYCGNADFLQSLWLWKTPLPDCGDDRGQTCTDYSEWTQAWTEIVG